MQPILKVDLSNFSTEEISIPASWEHEYLGGASLAARLLYEHLAPGLDPLAPEAPLLFLNGPLSGTAGPAVGRFVVTARSPATQLWGESNCGGFWGAELRTAGYDGLWITGRAEKPVYLAIRDRQVTLHSADHLWGMETYDTQQAIAQEWSGEKPRVACIGPAGEAGIPFSLILADHGRVAGRTGMGAVMGSKNLKAIAVRGHGKVPLYDPERYHHLRSIANRELRNAPLTQMLHDLGSAGGADYFDYLGEMPKKYFQKEVFPDAGKISGASVAETILDGVSACHACVIACGRVVRLADGRRRKGAEYETLVGFGPNLLLSDPAVATRLGELCDRYGMDTISLSNTIGLAITLFEQGFITSEDTDGLVLDWGDAALVERLIQQTVRREGLGGLLARGALALARQFGAEEWAVQVNGLEVAYHDPRGASGMALVYATSPRGACHNQSDYFIVDVGQAEAETGIQVLPRQAGAEKAGNVALHQDYRTVWNSLVLCYFASVPPKMIVALVNAAVGLDWDIAELMKAGERAWNLKRAINNRLGLRASWDRLPKLLLKPYPDAGEGSGGYVPDLDGMLKAYYQHRGWDAATGFATRQKLLELNLGWVIPDLWLAGQQEDEALHRTGREAMR